MKTKAEASKQTSEYIQRYFENLPKEGRIRQCTGRIAAQINKNNRYATSEVEDYVRRVVQNMTEDELALMETAIPVYASKIINTTLLYEEDCMKQITTSIYTFEKLIQRNALYVDKTKYFYRLVTSADGQFFCSRPRRFGKSLAISTLEAIFLGKKELFKGLYIYDQDYDWQAYPVVHLDFAGEVIRNQGILNESLSATLNDIARKYGVSISGSDSALLFKNLLRQLNEATGKPVVLLIDEYDKPLLDHMSSREEAEEWRKFMDAFYQIIKGSESVLRFVFLTGVTKFAKVSIFSKLNNLTDITMNEDYGEMFGYTQKELEENFKEYIDAAVEGGTRDNYGRKLSRQEFLSELRQWYDGFRFTEYTQSLYNPVSIGSFFNGHNRFKNYWFSTGTPSFLMRLLKRNKITAADLEGVLMPSGSFDTFDVAELAGEDVSTDRIMQMLYQTGYLTIDCGLPDFERVYQLCFPNFEVAFSFKRNLVTAYTGNDSVTFGLKLKTCARNGDTEGMIELLKTYFASFPYDLHIRQEKFYHSMIRVIFEMSGMVFVTEEKTNTGRIDAVLDMGGHLYIIEFKLNKTAEAALEQIDEKKYAGKYILPARERGQTIHKLGINFSYSQPDRNISEWKEEIIV